MSRKLYEVTVSCTFFWFGDAPPRQIEATHAAHDADCWEADSREVTTNTIGADPLELVFGTDDVTVEEALAEVSK